ncbi:MAG TPA: alpha/beta fold hydrolase [Thermodesulfobacteriota bacterium]
MSTLCGLHGLFGRPDHWAAVRLAFGARHRVVAPALPLTLEQARGGVPALTRFVAGWLSAQGIDQVVLLGNSFGGHVALDFALRYPSRVAGLVLAGSAGLLERGFTRGVPASPSPAFVRAKLEEVFHDPRFVTEGLVREVHGLLEDRGYARAMIAWARATRDYPMAEHLAAIFAPTLLVWGEEDRITPLAVAKAFLAGLPDAHLVTIPRCGHAPMLEAPGAFVAAVAGFLERLAARGAGRAATLARAEHAVVS